MKKIALSLLTTLTVASLTFPLAAKAESIDSSQSNTLVTPVEDKIVSVTDESEIYFINNNNSMLRAGIPRQVAKDIRVVKQNALGAFPSSIEYSQQEAGYITPWTGHLVLTRTWSQNNGSYTVYFAEYKGTVSAYLAG